MVKPGAPGALLGERAFFHLDNGQKLPAIVTHDFGEGTANLVVILDGENSLGTARVNGQPAFSTPNGWTAWVTSKKQGTTPGCWSLASPAAA